MITSDKRLSRRRPVGFFGPLIRSVSGDVPANHGSNEGGERRTEAVQDIVPPGSSGAAL